MLKSFMSLFHNLFVLRNEVPRYGAAYSEFERWFQRKQDPWDFKKDNYERARFGKLIDVVSRVPHDSILEVGCAEGDVTRLLCGISGDVTGIDVSQTAVERAQKSTPQAKIFKASLEDFNPKRRFQVALCAETLYYVGDIEAALAKLGALADFVVVTYTLYEKKRLDPFMTRLPLISHDKFTYLRFFEAGRLVNWRGFRIAVWCSRYAAPASV